MGEDSLEKAPKKRPGIVWCQPCTGAGWCMVKDVPYECMCGHLRRVAAGMPPYIRKADVDRRHVQLPLVRDPMQNAYVEASWSDVRAVVKILMMTGTHGHVMTVDEMELRNVYVGSMSKASKTKDYDGVVYNSISDFVGPPDLLIVRLNTLENKNKAAPGVLAEAIKLRVDYGKPVWLVSDIDRPFNQASFSYSDDVAELIVTSFRKHVIPRINRRDKDAVRDFFASPAPVAPAAPSFELEPDGSQQAAAPEGRAPAGGREGTPGRVESPSAQEDGEDLSSIYGGGIGPSKSKSRSRFRRS